MNQNIEKIRENLYAVNLNYVKSGYIAEMQILPDAEKKTGHVNLSNTGCVIIDKSSVLYPALKMLFVKVMDMPTKDLKTLAEQIEHTELDALENLYVNVAGWELKRRSVYAEYQKENPQPTFKNIIQKFIRKKVIEWHQFKQESS